MIDGKTLHFIDEFFVGSKNPPKQADEEEKEDNKGDNGPDGDVIDTLEHILIHSAFTLIVRFNLFFSVGCWFRLDVFAQPLQVSDQGYDLRIRQNFNTIGLQ